MYNNSKQILNKISQNINYFIITEFYSTTYTPHKAHAYGYVDEIIMNFESYDAQAAH